MSPAFAKTDCVGKKRAPQGNLVIRVSNGSDAVQIWRPWRWCLVARSSPKIQTLLSQGLDELERIKKSSKLQDYGHTSSGPTVYVLVTGRLYSDLKKMSSSLIWGQNGRYLSRTWWLPNMSYAYSKQLSLEKNWTISTGLSHEGSTFKTKWQKTPKLPPCRSWPIYVHLYVWKNKVNNNFHFSGVLQRNYWEQFSQPSVLIHPQDQDILQVDDGDADEEVDQHGTSSSNYSTCQVPRQHGWTTFF